MFRLGYLCAWVLLFTAFQSVAGINTGNKLSFQQLPKVKIDTPKKANLLKQLSEAIKFRKKAITNEQKRVQGIIEKMISKDSTMATVQDLEKLKTEMSESNKQLFDTLLALIKDIKIPESTTIPETSPGAGPNNKNKPFQVTKELDPNDKYINDLVDRLVPMLTDTKEDDDKVKTRQEKLRLMRAIYANNNVFTDTLPDSTAKRYTLKLSHRAEVMGNIQYDVRYSASKYNMSTLTTLLFNSYDLDGSTGYAKNFSQWQNAGIISSAQEAGAKVLLSVTTKNSLEMAKFLTNASAMKNMISNTLGLLEARNADGINIAVTGLNQKLRASFVNFMTTLSKAYRAKSKLISITLPVYDEVKAYDIPSLDTLVDRFIIDFSKRSTNFPGPIAPLNDESDYSIQSAVSRYLNIGLPPYKFILCLPYYGAEYTLNPRTEVETFKQYVPYKTIRLNYQYAPVTYDKDQAYATIETRNDEGDLTGHIYYDNETSLEQKYDFINQNGLGGVAIWQLGADDGYGELWDALANKFLRIDTVSAVAISLRPRTNLSIWEYIKTNSVLYYYALQDPCNPNYGQPDPLMLTIFNIFLGLLSVILIITLIYQIKANGEKWKWKKLLIRILIVCVNLFIITIFMWLYIDSSIPWFGPGKNCVNMPFGILLLIIFTGILLGSLIMRFLIFPAIQRDEKP